MGWGGGGKGIGVGGGGGRGDLSYEKIEDARRELLF